MKSPVAHRERQPTHPGAVLREDVLPELGLDVTSCAQLLKVSRRSLRSLLSKRAGMTPPTADRVGKLCGNGADPWLRMQRALDRWQAERAISS